ncbi:MAG TPA: enolase C-terminal domain-like protein [Chloroflexota bacterium]|nr:enolase C-terminal domain-like protein [Chloroflexota bacterium]
MTSIRRVDIFTAELPFRLSFGHALAARRSSTNVYVRVILSDGSVGLGEGVPRDYVTGETVDSAVTVLANRYAPSVLGRGVAHAADVPTLIDDLALIAEPHGAPEPAAWCALELALLDAYGKHFSQPVSAWLGNAPADKVRYDFIVPFAGRRTIGAIGLAVRALGFANVKLKVGEDLDRAAHALKTLRALAGQSVDLRVDANCAWTPERAMQAIEHLRPFRISSVEQPVAAADLAGLRRITAATSEAIIVDESLCSVGDALRLLDARACDAFNIRVSKCGGLLNSARIAGIAEAAGLACVVGAQVGESGLLSAAGRHLAASLAGVRYVEGSAGRLLLKEDLTMENVLPGWGGWARPFTGPGLGVRVQPALLGRFGHLRRTLERGSRPLRAAA